MRFREGDESALEYLFHLLVPTLTLFANRLLHDRPVSEDIASMAMVKAWQRKPGCTSIETFSAYLYKIVQRDCWKEAKRQAKYIAFQKNTDSEETILETPFEQILRSETYRILYSSITTLSDGNARVISMHFLDEKSIADIAKETNLSPATIKTQKQRALKALRKSLQVLKQFLLISFH